MAISLASQLSMVADSGRMEITPEEALQRVDNELRSLTIRRQVFDNNVEGLIEEKAASQEELDNAFFDHFNPALAVTMKNT